MSVLELATLKEYLQISHGREDATLQITLDACEAAAAAHCSVRIAAEVTTSLVENVSSIGREWIYPTQHPILSVDEVLDNELTSGDPEDPDDYGFDSFGIYVVDHGKWGEGEQRYKVTYKAGYDGTTYPAMLKLGVLKMAYAMYHGQSGAGRGDAVVTEEIAGMLWHCRFDQRIG